MGVRGQFQMTSRSQVSSDDLLVLHFILESLEGIGSPARLLHQYMQAFIQPSAIVYEEVVFNMGSVDQLASYGRKVNELVQHLSSNGAQRVVIFITNHSHEITGDLFVAPAACAPVAEVSESLQL
jgi:hypothetical protein